MESLLQDIRYGLRGLWKRPAFTLVALTILALGIGANTAIFTLINAVLLKPLPVSHPEELVLFDDSAGEGTSISDGDPPPGQRHRYSFEQYRYFREHDKSFQELCAFRSGESRVSVRRSDAPAGAAAERASSHLVTGNYFAVLGINALKGRVLNNEDDSAAAPPAAVISNDYWKKKMNGDTQVVGKNVLLNGTAFTIVGVMPPGFFGERVRRSPDFWLPLAFQPQIELRKSFLEDKTAYWLNFLGRLKPGVQIGQAQVAVNTELRQFMTDQYGSKLTDDIRRAIENGYLKLTPGGRGVSGLRTFYAKALRMLMVIVALVLLIACANVGNLLLSRAATRQAEVSLRQALGASRARLLRQLLTESLLLALLGGIVGVLLAQWGVSLLVARVAATSPLDVKPDASVLLFSVGISLVAGVLFGIAPALRATRTDLTSALKEKATQGRRGYFNLGSVLVVAQVAVSLVLLVGAGLFARSLVNLQKEDLGFNRDNVLLASIDSRLAGYKPAELNTLYRQLYDRLSALPNVRSVSMASYSPLSGSNSSSSLVVRGYTPQKGEDIDVTHLQIGPRYAETLGIPLLLGREFNLQDTAASTKVAVVNQSFVDAYLAGQNPIGRRITFDGDSDKDDLEIVGVIGDIKAASAREKADRAVYQPIFQVQDQQTYNNTLELRTAGDPQGIAGEVRAAITQVDDKLPIISLTSLRVQTEESLSEERLLAQLVSFFGLLGLALSCVGLYGIMAHAVVRRTNEIGIRMALGAERRDIVWMVLKESLMLVGAGLLIGVPAAWAGSHLIASQLFGLNPSDPMTLGISAVLLTFVAALAGYIPARKASRVNPLVALRYE
jgi:macrolide transport system ATP-binding/permease protein